MYTCIRTLFSFLLSPLAVSLCHTLTSLTHKVVIPNLILVYNPFVLLVL